MKEEVKEVTKEGDEEVIKVVVKGRAEHLF